MLTPFLSIADGFASKKGGGSPVFALRTIVARGATVNVLHLFVVNLLPYKISLGKFTTKQNSVYKCRTENYPVRCMSVVGVCVHLHTNS